jgi:hypothetical protein
LPEIMHEMLAALIQIWGTPGVSEFLSALLGGSVTLVAQFLALRHDREKEAHQQANEQKAQALTATAKELSRHRKTADLKNLQLWQILQFSPHDWNTVTWDINELVLLIDNKHFDLMQRYQEVIWWLSNLVQSVQFYREMRIEFLTKTPSEVQGDRGSIAVTRENSDAIMPTIAHLKSMSESLEAVILKQAPEARKLLKDYADTMKTMIGMKPNIQFLDEEHDGI